MIYNFRFTAFARERRTDECIIYCTPYSSNTLSFELMMKQKNNRNYSL